MGRQIRHIALLVLFFVFSALSAQSQFKPAPVEKSKQKIIYQGKIFYVHTVKENQTLYSISRAYGVTQQDIAANNPNLALEVITTGQAIRIPTISTLNTLSEEYFDLSKDDFYYHTIQQHQTVLYLTRKYNVPESLIYKYNPGTEDVLQVGQIIKVPKHHIVVTDLPKANASDTSKTYLVKAGDTLYSLSRRFGVSVADFIAINPELRWGLKAGMILTIPGMGLYTDPILTDTDGSELFINRLKLLSTEDCEKIQSDHAPKATKIVLMLPFNAIESLTLDSISNDSIRKAHPFRRKKVIGRSFIEFYEGFLIAMDSLKSAGHKITLFTYDTRYDTNNIDEIIKEVGIIRPNFIVGPIKPENIKKVSAFSDSNNIPLILPLSKADYKLTGHNPYAVSLSLDFKTEIDLASDFLSHSHDKNIILIHNQDSSRMDNLNLLRNSLFAHFSSKLSYEKALFKELRYNDTLQKNLTHTLRNDIENIIIIVSNNEAYVSNVLGLLTIQDEVYQIQVFGLPSWQKFKNLRVDQLHMMNTVLYSPFFIDYNKPSTQRFIELCRNKLGFEPYKTVSNGSGYNFCFLGYETGLLFSKAFKTYGEQFVNCLCEIQETLPQLEYRFKINPWGGFRINSVNIINFSTEFNLNRIPFIYSDELLTDMKSKFNFQSNTNNK